MFQIPAWSKLGGLPAEVVLQADNECGSLWEGAVGTGFRLSGVTAGLGSQKDPPGSC